ncbi:MAG: hypothetical protein WAW88_17640, partial [Nocardioides sp.]
DAVLAALADDLNAPAALGVIDDWATRTAAGEDSDPEAGAAISALVDAALGIQLTVPAASAS